MTVRVLVAFHSVEGQADKVAHRISDVLTGDGVSVDVMAIEDAPAPDGYDGVVFGDSIHAVHHSRQLAHYLRENVDAVNSRASALFQVSLTSANPDEAHTATALGLVHELTDATGFDPDMVGMFAGKLAYTQYGWMKKRIMRSIVKREGGDLDMTRDHEYTDWPAVDQFAHDFALLVRG